jgi:hypothetical protein
MRQLSALNLQRVDSAELYEIAIPSFCGNFSFWSNCKMVFSFFIIVMTIMKLCSNQESIRCDSPFEIFRSHSKTLGKFRECEVSLGSREDIWNVGICPMNKMKTVLSGKNRILISDGSLMDLSCDVHC